MSSDRASGRANETPNWMTAAWATVISSLVAALSAVTVAYFGSQSTATKAVAGRTTELEALRAEANELRQAVSVASSTADNSSKRVAALDQKATELDARYSGIEGRLQHLATELAAIKDAARSRVLGDPIPKAFDEMHIAEKSGLVFAWVTAHQATQILVLYGTTKKDGEAEVRRAVAHLRVNGNETNSADISFAVRKGEQWRVEIKLADGTKAVKGSGAWLYPIGE